MNGTLSGGGAGMEPMWGGPPPHHMQHHVQPPSVGPPPSVIATPGAKLGQGPVPGSYIIVLSTLFDNYKQLKFKNISHLVKLMKFVISYKKNCI